MPPQLLGVNSHCPRDLFSHASPSTEIMYFLIGNQPICLHYHIIKTCSFGLRTSAVCSYSLSPSFNCNLGFSDLQAEILFAISDNDLLGYAHVGLPICPEQVGNVYGTMTSRTPYSFGTVCLQG